MAGKCLVITFGMTAMKSLENHTIQAKEINSFPHKLVPISGALLRNIMRRLWLTIIGVVGPRTFINNSQDSFAWEWVSTNRPRLLPRETKSRTSLPYFPLISAQPLFRPSRNLFMCSRCWRPIFKDTTGRRFWAVSLRWQLREPRSSKYCQSHWLGSRRFMNYIIPARAGWCTEKNIAWTRG